MEPPQDAGLVRGVVAPSFCGSRAGHGLQGRGQGGQRLCDRPRQAREVHPRPGKRRFHADRKRPPAERALLLERIRAASGSGADGRYQHEPAAGAGRGARGFAPVPRPGSSGEDGQSLPHAIRHGRVPAPAPDLIAQEPGRSPGLCGHTFPAGIGGPGRRRNAPL